MALIDNILGASAQTVPPLLNKASGTQQAITSMNQVVGSNSPYIQNARRRGIETAAARGGINSSIAAGASERAAIEGAMPLVQQGLQIDQSAQNAQNEYWLNNQKAQYDNWLSELNFGRAMQSNAFNNTASMLRSIQEYALADPETYTPDVVSGMSNFFDQIMNERLQRYFGGT